MMMKKKVRAETCGTCTFSTLQAEAVCCKPAEWGALVPTLLIGKGDFSICTCCGYVWHAEHVPFSCHVLEYSNALEINSIRNACGTPWQNVFPDRVAVAAPRRLGTTAAVRSLFQPGRTSRRKDSITLQVQRRMLSMRRLEQGIRMPCLMPCTIN